jgi:glycosyltransferase involved in cell wall biosynthesis
LHVSVLIPIYNRQAQALRAIDSVLAQTAPVAEIVVVDDGSTDGAGEVISARYGSQVRVIRQENQGVSAARNRGIREARGEWVALLDSDDFWLPTKMERQLEALFALGSGFGVCFTDNVFDGDPKLDVSKFREAGFESASKFGSLAEPARLILAGREPFFTSSFLFQRSLFNEITGFDEAMVIGEDTDVFFRMSFKTKFCYVAEPLVHVDRDPSREVGLCNLYFTRDDRKYDSLTRKFAKWLAMPEVIGTEFERPVRAALRDLCYDSAESKLHEFRIGPALHEVARLKRLGDGYPAILANFVSRKLRKLRRDRAQWAPRPT